MEFPHKPVMVHEVLEALLTDPEGVYLDGTVGSGGHSEAIGKRIRPGGRLICLDRDPEAVRLSEERLRPFGEMITVMKANYAEMDEVLAGLGMDAVDGILLDLGLSSQQLEQSGRGFSFQREEPLDMRMDPGAGSPACDLVNILSPAELEKILRDYGEERRARSIARSIDKARNKAPIESSLRLANLVRAVFPPSYRPGMRHPATRTFQALRIAVNRELDHLRLFLEKAPSLIAKRGRLVVLSYHSLEDRMVKRSMADWERGCSCPPDLPTCACGKNPIFKRLSRKGLRPDQEEIAENPRARSATLRAAERI